MRDTDYGAGYANANDSDSEPNARRCNRQPDTAQLHPATGGRHTTGVTNAPRTPLARSPEPLRTGSALMHPGCSIDQVYLCREPIDFRKAINGLSALVEQELGLSPFASALYVFTNRRHTQLKALYWHRNGFCLWQKRLEVDQFAWPADAKAPTASCSLHEFGWLLEGFDLSKNTPHKTLNFARVS